MELQTIKNQILSNSLSKINFIFKIEDNNFLAIQYVEEISKLKNSPIIYINSLDDIKQSLLEDTNLYVLKVDKLTYTIPTELNNIIVICEEVDKGLKVDVVKFPKLVDWQIKEYMKSLVPGLNEDSIEWLFKRTKGDIFRINNECKKLTIFSKEYHNPLFNQIKTEYGYSDLLEEGIYDFLNAITRKDKVKVNHILKHIHSLDIEASGLATMLKRSFKNILDIQLNPKATPESLNMSWKQFNAIKYQTNKYSNEDIIRIFKFLANFDYLLKSGNLDMEKDDLMSYLICMIIGG